MEKSDYDMSTHPTTNILVTSILKGKRHLCLTLNHAKRNGTNYSEDKINYAFVITKANQIFDHILKYKHIELLNDHKIPPIKKIKDNRYFKWHNF